MSGTTKDKAELPENERMMPEQDGGTLMYAEHITRYQAALPFVKNKVVLDIASGSGYGTHMMAKQAKHAYGVDVSQEAIDFSNKHYGLKNVEFRIGDGESIPLEDGSIDVVTTFETIEHIEDYKQFLKEIKRVLAPNGIAIVSTPNDVEYPEGNHFHLHEFTYDELLGLLKKQYKYIVPYFQTTYKAVVTGPKDMITQGHSATLLTQNLSLQSEDRCLYFYFVCSDKKISATFEPNVTFGEIFSERQYVADTKQLWALADARRDYIEDADKRIKKLEADLEAANNALREIANSTSWKMTRPMRSANNIVRKAVSTRPKK